jgi:putative FmdB family regulatory protein
VPIYEYKCTKCGEFEVMQKITESPLKKCPTCKSKVTKLMSNTSFQLKGSGWYITDYGRSGSKTASGESKGDGKGESKSEGKTESRSEGTSEGKASETKSSETKSSESKTSESKTSEPKSSKNSAKAA